MKTTNARLRAFTLTELLIVLVIIGILVMMALPKLMPIISKAKSTEAQLQLEHLYTLEKNHFYMYSKFSQELEEIGFEHADLVEDGGNANYRISVVESTNNTFKATATAVTDFDGDGVYNVWQIDQNKKLKEVIKD
ncbi:MAG: prepilin-type N-terminal cleavage/methylation domain-containing protein [Vicingaceae bacterium]